MVKDLREYPIELLVQLCHDSGISNEKFNDFMFHHSNGDGFAMADLTEQNCLSFIAVDFRHCPLITHIAGIGHPACMEAVSAAEDYLRSLGYLEVQFIPTQSAGELGERLKEAGYTCSRRGRFYKALL